MKIRSLVAVVIAVFLVAAGCGSSSDEPNIEIESARTSGGGGGKFVATGSAVDSGHFCDSGQFLTIEESEPGETEWSDDEYTCDDGTGTIIIRQEKDPAEVEEGFATGTGFDGTWTITTGTGDYLDVTGEGTFHADLEPQWVETYTGNATIP